MEAQASLLLLDLESESDEEVTLQCLSSLLLNKRTRGKTSDFLKYKDSASELSFLSELSDDVFKETYRLSRVQFQEIHDMIEDDIRGKESNAKSPIATEKKLAVCLRYLVSGERYKTIALNYRIGDRTVSNIVNEVCAALWTHLQPIYMPEPDIELWKKIASDYESKWSFCNCLGAIGGKRIITIQKVGISSATNDRESPHVILVAAVDAHYRFTFIDIMSAERFNDENVFENTLFGKRLCNTSKLPEPNPLPGTEQPIPYVFVADETIPVIDNLMRAYPGQSVMNSYEKKVFNCRIGQAQQTAECSFGILSKIFHVFKKPFKCKLEAVETIVMSCCILHNYLRTKILLSSDTCDDNCVFELPFENENQLLPLKKYDMRIHNALYSIREKMKDFYISPQGSVEWQHSAIENSHF
ncbi:uncharacterized protein LOC111058518 [Nilaparvata lugens]|uniref:uncharacterized protein LOC111058518 n=1 Tax=Nilaparvata lugens TaxID=108931 RepID=UPI00193DCE66|nr:uncharacterized protein LOC111058518 [Nilaparvata lugens]